MPTALVIVPFYAALLAITFIVLSIRVIQLRRSEKVTLGDGNHPGLRRAISAHANFSQYVPLGLILLTFVEMGAFSPVLVHVLCLALLGGRLCHAYGISQENEDFRFRVMGMKLTLATIGTATLLLIGTPFMRLV